MAADTWGDLVQSTITFSNRDDVSDIIIVLLREAIARAQRDWFYPAEQTVTFPTVVGQVNYPLPETLVSVTWLRMNYANTWMWLPEVLYETILHIDVNIPSTQSVPSMFARFDSLIRLYPAPDQIYDLEATGNGRIPIPADDATSNFWTIENQGAPYIRYSALAQLYRTRIRDDANYQRMAMAAEEYRIALVRETVDKSSEKRVQSAW